MSEYIITAIGKKEDLAQSMGFTEIVRCRDCVYCDKYPNDEMLVCFRVDTEFEINTDGFCAWGERRES